MAQAEMRGQLVEMFARTGDATFLIAAAPLASASLVDDAADRWQKLAEADRHKRETSAPEAPAHRPEINDAASLLRMALRIHEGESVSAAAQHEAGRIGGHSRAATAERLRRKYRAIRGKDSPLQVLAKNAKAAMAALPSGDEAAFNLWFRTYAFNDDPLVLRAEAAFERWTKVPPT